jgi:hypothetical protein
LESAPAIVPRCAGSVDRCPGPTHRRVPECRHQMTDDCWFRGHACRLLPFPAAHRKVDILHILLLLSLRPSSGFAWAWRTPLGHVARGVHQ